MSRQGDAAASKSIQVEIDRRLDADRSKRALEAQQAAEESSRFEEQRTLEHDAAMEWQHQIVTIIRAELASLAGILAERGIGFGVNVDALEPPRMLTDRRSSFMMRFVSPPPPPERSPVVIERRQVCVLEEEYRPGQSFSDPEKGGSWEAPPIHSALGLTATGELVRFNNGVLNFVIDDDALVPISKVMVAVERDRFLSWWHERIVDWGVRKLLE